jgi:hypothetical protein
MIDLNQMLVAGFAIAARHRDRRIPMPADPSRNRPHGYDSPIWLKQFKYKLSQNVVPVSHLCRELSQTRLPAET